MTTDETARFLAVMTSPMPQGVEHALNVPRLATPCS